jgi:taurine dioxygenase
MVASPAPQVTIMSLTINFAEGPIGAEILGADLSREVDAQTLASIRGALDERGVIVLRTQNLKPEHIARFAEHFGRPLVHAHNKFALPNAPAVSVISNIVDEQGRNVGVPDAGLVWHTDGSYLVHPDMYAFLYGIEIPMHDGEPLGTTYYSSATAAYDALPEVLRNRLDGLRAVHSFAYHAANRAARGGTKIEITEELRRKHPDVSQPVVRTHPRTGRKTLYVTEGHTTHILGMDRAESDALLKQLFAHLCEPRFVYGHRWQVGDLLVWDNASTQHRATCDYALPQRRLMHRTATAGEESVGVALA